MPLNRKWRARKMQYTTIKATTIDNVKPMAAYSYKKRRDPQFIKAYSNQLLQMVKSTSLLVAAATVLSSCVLAAPANISYNNILPFGKRSSSSYQCSSDDNPSLMVIKE